MMRKMHRSYGGTIWQKCWTGLSTPNWMRSGSDMTLDIVGDGELVWH